MLLLQNSLQVSVFFEFPPLSYYKITLLISFAEKPIPPVHRESSSAFNDDLPPLPPRVSIKEKLEGIKTIEAEVKKSVDVETEKTVEVEKADIGVTKPKSPKVVAQGPEKKNSFIEEEVPVITIPSTSAPASELLKDDVQENPINVEPQGFFACDAEEDSPIRPDQTPGDYYYRTYSEKRASNTHAPVWKLKQGDSFSDWQVCREWFQGTFPPAEINFQEEQTHERTYRAYLQETASSSATTHRIASKKEIAGEKAKVVTLRTKLEVDQVKFEDDQKTEEWSAMGWKKKVETAHDEALSLRERSEQREVQTCATLALRNKEIEELTSLLTDQEKTMAELESAKKDLQLERVEKDEATCRHAEMEKKLENSGAVRVTTESLIEPLRNDMLWMKHHGIINVANSVLNSIDLDQTVAQLMVTARNNSYAQGYAEFTQHVTSALKVD
ncbi:hypothetical protein Hanom_Chr12g01138001 [Helianthus anomalus]